MPAGKYMAMELDCRLLYLSCVRVLVSLAPRVLTCLVQF